MRKNNIIYPSQFPKKCACGREYTQEEWEKLHFVGWQDGINNEVYELRNCFCKSTLMVKVKGIKRKDKGGKYD